MERIARDDADRVFARAHLDTAPRATILRLPPPMPVVLARAQRGAMHLRSVTTWSTSVATGPQTLAHQPLRAPAPAHLTRRRDVRPLDARPLRFACRTRMLPASTRCLRMLGVPRIGTRHMGQSGLRPHRSLDPLRRSMHPSTRCPRWSQTNAGKDHSWSCRRCSRRACHFDSREVH